MLCLLIIKNLKRYKEVFGENVVRERGKNFQKRFFSKENNGDTSIYLLFDTYFSFLSTPKMPNEI